MFFDVAAVLAIALCLVYTWVKKRDFLPSLLILADFALCSFVATSLTNAGIFEGITFYIWFAIYGALRFAIAALLSVWAIFGAKNRFLALPVIAYFLYGLFCFLIIIQHIPNANSDYPLEFILPVYEYYEVVHYSFTTLILIVLSDIGSGGRVIRLPFFSCRRLFGNAHSFNLSNVSTGQGYDHIHDDQRE